MDALPRDGHLCSGHLFKSSLYTPGSHCGYRYLVCLADASCLTKQVEHLVERQAFGRHALRKGQRKVCFICIYHGYSYFKVACAAWYGTRQMWFVPLLRVSLFPTGLQAAFFRTRLKCSSVSKAGLSRRPGHRLSHR